MQGRAGARQAPDLAGQAFGRWSVVRYVGHSTVSGDWWWCRCRCGTAKAIRGHNLRLGATRSCGCSRWEDMTGRVFGRWTVLGEAGVRGKARYWRCRCECGVVRDVQGSCLRGRRTRSCGCREDGLRTFHGWTGQAEWRAWVRMRARCENPRDRSYRDYGGRGIRVCRRWRRFWGFYLDMGPRPGPGYSLDRRDNDGHYEPRNCRWATAAQQLGNTRASRRYVFQGRPRTVAEIARRSGIIDSTLRSRLARGWSIDQAVQPVERISECK